jgi:hypothetical protein
LLELLRQMLGCSLHADDDIPLDQRYGRGDDGKAWW